MTISEGTGEALDPDVAAEEIDPGELERRLDENVRGYETQLAEAQETVERVKTKFAKAQAAVAEASQAVEDAGEEVTRLEGEVEAARARRETGEL